jgi:hypothetical protein
LALVRILGEWRVGLSPIACEGPALDVAELMAKDRHGQIRDFGTAGRAFPSLLRGHVHNLAMTSRSFHSLSTILFLE